VNCWRIRQRGLCEEIHRFRELRVTVGTSTFKCLDLAVIRAFSPHEIEAALQKFGEIPVDVGAKVNEP
jgi:hypothetical protein